MIRDGHRRRVARIELQRFPHFIYRFVFTALCVECDSQIPMRVGLVRPTEDRFAQELFRFCKAAILAVENGDVDQAGYLLRIQPVRLIEMFQSQLELAGLLVAEPDPCVSPRAARLLEERLRPERQVVGPINEAVDREPCVRHADHREKESAAVQAGVLFGIVRSRCAATPGILG